MHRQQHFQSDLDSVAEGYEDLGADTKWNMWNVSNICILRVKLSYGCMPGSQQGLIEPGGYVFVEPEWRHKEGM